MEKFILAQILLLVILITSSWLLINILQEFTPNINEALIKNPETSQIKSFWQNFLSSIFSPTNLPQKLKATCTVSPASEVQPCHRIDFTIKVTGGTPPYDVKRISGYNGICNSSYPYDTTVCTARNLYGRYYNAVFSIRSNDGQRTTVRCVGKTLAPNKLSCIAYPNPGFTDQNIYFEALTYPANVAFDYCIQEWRGGCNGRGNGCVTKFSKPGKYKSFYTASLYNELGEYQQKQCSVEVTVYELK
jgi:hypothetical protein